MGKGRREKDGKERKPAKFQASKPKGEAVEKQRRRKKSFGRMRRRGKRGRAKKKKRRGISNQQRGK